MLILCCISAKAQQTVNYWFDQQTGRTSYDGGAIDCSSLPFGVHAVHFQIIDNKGFVCPAKTQIFLFLDNSESKPSTVSYWFDQQTEHTTYDGGAINCSSLPFGVHTVHFQITDNKGFASPAKSQIFLFIDNSESKPSSICYWFDQQTKRTTYNSGAIDCSSLPNGVHAVHFQITDNNGFVSPTQTQIFLKLEDTIYKLCYWFDESAERNIMSIDETEINVEHLSNGVHILHAMLVDDKGNAVNTIVESKKFVIVCKDTEHVDNDQNGSCDVCGEHITVTGIHSHTIEKDENGPIYNLSGIRIPRSTKGIVIINGKKILNK